MCDDIEIVANIASVVASCKCNLDSKGCYCGHGEALFSNGNTFKGNFHNGMMSGGGKYCWTSLSMSYEGELRMNAITGKGRYQWSNGTSYEGFVNDGLRHGYGVFYSSNGKVLYEGNWLNGMRDGYGIQYYDSTNNSTYKGSWKANKRDGDGEMIYSNGNTFIGEWCSDLRTGNGTMLWKDSNQRYEGNWLEDKQHGYGIHVWLDNPPTNASAASTAQRQMCNTYKGQWVQGQRHGFGEFYYSNGSRYVGMWQDNLKHGAAVYISENGSVFKGNFINDKVSIEDFKHSSESCTDIIQLNVEDLVAYKNSAQIREIEKILFQFNSELKNIYNVYARKSINKQDKKTEVFTMRAEFLIEFLEKIKVLSPNSMISVADVYRILFRMRRHLALSIKHMMPREYVANSLLCFPVEDAAEFFKPEQPIFLRDFMEFIVRFSELYYTGNSTVDFNIETISSNQRYQHQTLAQSVKQFLKQHIILNLVQEKGFFTGSTSVKKLNTSEVLKNNDNTVEMVQPIILKLFNDICANDAYIGLDQGSGIPVSKILRLLRDAKFFQTALITLNSAINIIASSILPLAGHEKSSSESTSDYINNKSLILCELFKSDLSFEQTVKALSSLWENLVKLNSSSVINFGLDSELVPKDSVGAKVETFHCFVQTLLDANNIHLSSLKML